jgi:hypothetical protein
MVTTKKGTGLNKSAEIRKALAQYPHKRPAEIARMLAKQHKVPFERKTVSKIKTAMERNSTPTRKPVVPVVAQKAWLPQASSAGPATAGGVAEMVANLQAYIQHLGREDLHRLIDRL